MKTVIIGSIWKLPGKAHICSACHYLTWLRTCSLGKPIPRSVLKTAAIFVRLQRTELVIPVVTGVRCCLAVGLIFISLMMTEADHLFMYGLAIYVSSLKKRLFISSTHSLIRLFVFLLLSYMNSLYVLDRKPLSDIWFENPSFRCSTKDLGIILDSVLLSIPHIF